MKRMNMINKQKIKILSEYIRLDQLLKWAGFADAGSEAKFLIAAGKIMVNEEIEWRRGRKIYQGDKIRVTADKVWEIEVELERTD